MRQVQLVLTARLNRETRASHALRLTAVDGGVPPRSGSLLVLITVLDSNDNKPEFGRAQYEVRLVENAPIGTVVLRVQATDSDIGPNGQVAALACQPQLVCDTPMCSESPLLRSWRPFQDC